PRHRGAAATDLDGGAREAPRAAALASIVRTCRAPTGRESDREIARIPETVPGRHVGHRTPEREARVAYLRSRRTGDRSPTPPLERASESTARAEEGRTWPGRCQARQAGEDARRATSSPPGRDSRENTRNDGARAPARRCRDIVVASCSTDPGRDTR